MLLNSKLNNKADKIYQYKIFSVGEIISKSLFIDFKDIFVIVMIGSTGYQFYTKIFHQGYYELGNANSYARITYGDSSIVLNSAYIGSTDYTSVTHLEILYK